MPLFFFSMNYSWNDFYRTSVFLNILILDLQSYIWANNDPMTGSCAWFSTLYYFICIFVLVVRVYDSKMYYKTAP